MKRLKIGFYLSLVIFPLFGYVYWKGCQDGVKYYKHSKKFSLTLLSMYRFGYMDGYDARCGEKK